MDLWGLSEELPLGEYQLAVNILMTMFCSHYGEKLIIRFGTLKMHLKMDGIRGGKILQMAINNHFVTSFRLLIACVGFICILIYLKFDPDAITVFSIALLIDAVPALYLHIEYWIKNRGEEYEIRDNEIILRKHGKEMSYKNQDIEKIIIYLSPSLYKNSNFHLLAIESYHYAILRLKTGDEVVLTCLLAPRMDKALKQIRGVLIEREKKLFCKIANV